MRTQASRWKLLLPLLFVMVAGLLFAASLAPRQAVAQQVPASFTPLPTFTPVPTITLLPSPTSPNCPTPLPLANGSLVSLEPGVNVRNLPSVSGAVANYYTQDTVLTIAGGPVCSNGYNWWYVVGAGNPGWVIEGFRGRIVLTAISGTPDPSSICLPAAALVVGEEARVLTGVLLHELPNESSLVLHSILSNEAVDVLAGPVCVNNLNWWQVRAAYPTPNDPNGTIVGWVADGFPGTYWLAALNAPPVGTPNYCPRPLRLNVGARAAVTYDDRVPRTLRDAPSVSAAPVQTLIAGVAFEITGASVCADGFNFWPIRLLQSNTTGWLAEGRPGNYWFDVVIEATSPASVEPSRTPIPTPTGFGV